MLCAISTISYVERVNVTVVGDYLMRDYRIDQTQMGGIFTAFLLGYAVFQIPAGLLSDRFGPRRVLAGALLCWGSLTLLTALAEYLVLASWLGVLNTLLVVRFLLGISASPTYPAAARSISQWVTPSQRAGANALVLAGIAVGSALTPPALAHLAVAVGWQAALLVSSLPAFLMAIVWLWYSRDEPPSALGQAVHLERTEGQKATTPVPSHRQTQGTARLLRDANLWLLSLSYALQGYISYVFVYWFFLYLVQVRHFTLLEGSWLATLPWLLTLITTPLGGGLSDLLVRRAGPPWGRRLVPLLALALAGGLLMLGARCERPYLAAALLAVCEALVMSVEGAFWATVTELAPARVGTVGGVLNMAGNLGGLLAPLLTPWVAATFGWIVAFDLAASIAILGGGLWLWISPRAAMHSLPLDSNSLGLAASRQDPEVKGTSLL
jgi:ACS family glucarate transporter-like MFS transporter